MKFYINAACILDFHTYWTHLWAQCLSNTCALNKIFESDINRVMGDLYNVILWTIQTWMELCLCISKCNLKPNWSLSKMMKCCDFDMCSVFDQFIAIRKSQGGQWFCLHCHFILRLGLWVIILVCLQIHTIGNSQSTLWKA